MSKNIAIVAAGLFMGLIAMPAQAQDAFNNFEQSDRREVHLGVSIPFGATGKTANEKPRLQLGVRDYRARDSHNWALSGMGAGQDYTQHSLAMTVSDTPSFLINNRELQFGEDEKLGLGTVEMVAVGAAAIVVTVILIGTANECTDGHDNPISIC